MDGDGYGFDLNDPGDWAHAICIIGWNPDHNSFIYYDPADGSYKDTFDYLYWWIFNYWLKIKIWL